MPERIIYPTERPDVELRQLIPNDAQAYFDAVDSSREHLSEYNLTTVRDYPRPVDVLTSITDPSDSSRLRLGIWDSEQFVGTINVTQRGQDAEIGYWVDGRFTSNGYATVATRALAARAPRYVSPFTRIHPQNTASKAVMERSGFRIAGKRDGELIYRYVRSRSDRPSQQEPVLYVGELERTADYSVARIGLRGMNAMAINHLSDTEYRVVHGEGTMTHNSGPSVRLYEGRQITIPKGVSYRDEGHLVMVATCTPPFNPAYVEHVA